MFGISNPLDRITRGGGIVQVALDGSISLVPLTGKAVTAPTATLGDNSTQVATTAFVLANAGSAPVSSVFGRTGAVVAVGGDYSSISQGGGSVSVGADGTITCTTAAAKAFTVNGASSSSFSLGTDGSITLTPASGKNATLGSGGLLLGTADANGMFVSVGAAGRLDIRDGTNSSATGILRMGQLETYRSGGNSSTVSAREGTSANATVRLNSGATDGTGSLQFLNAGTADVILTRDAANTLANRNGTNAQKQRWYETYTDASNGGWFEVVTQTGGPTLLRSQANGSGTVRPVWYQNKAGRARVTADATNATATMANLSDLSVTLIAGRKYTGRLVLIANDSQSAEGLQFDCNGGTATITSFQMNAEETPIGATLGTTNSTALATALNDTAVSTTDTAYCFSLSMVVNAGGTFIPRFAQNSHTLGTATVRLGSYLLLDDSPN